MKKAVKKDNVIVGNYKKCWEFFKECRWYFVFAMGLFFLFFIIGFMFPVFYRAEIIQLISEFKASLAGLNSVELTIHILINNTKAALMALALGIGIGIRIGGWRWY